MPTLTTWYLLGAALLAAGCGQPSPATVDASVVDASTDAPPGTVGELVPLLDLGHLGGASVAGLTADRVLTVDVYGHWILWDRDARSTVASGDTPTCSPGVACLAGGGALAGSTFAIWSDEALELHDAASGALTARLAVDLRAGGDWSGWCGLAVDGSYAYATTSTGLRAWSHDGALLLDRAGAYGDAHVFAAPGEFRVAGRTTPLEAIAVGSGAATSAAFAGLFLTWFEDGAHFVTIESLGLPPTASTRLRVYTRAGLLVGQRDGDAASVAGVGSYLSFITLGELRIHALTDLDTPLARIAVPADARVHATSTALAIADEHGGLRMIRLGATIDQGPALRSDAGEVTSVKADAAGWAAVSDSVVYLGSASFGPPLTRGHVVSAATASGGAVATVTTQSGVTEVLRWAGDRPRLAATITTPSSRTELTADGAVVLARSARQPYALRAIDSTTGVVLRTWPYDAAGGERLLDFSVVPATGRTVHVVERPTTPVQVGRRVFELDGTEVADVGPPVIPLRVPPEGWSRPQFAPSGHDAAYQVTDGQDYVDAHLQLFHDGVAGPIVDGVALGWIDDARFLASIHETLTSYRDVIYRPDGSVLVELPNLAIDSPFVPVGGGLLYVPLLGDVHDLATGDIVWDGPYNLYTGTALGDHALRVDGHWLVAERFRP